MDLNLTQFLTRELFPIGVAAYMIIKLDKTLGSLDDNIKRLIHFFEDKAEIKIEVKETDCDKVCA